MEPLSLDAFIKLARENLLLFSRRYKRYHKTTPHTFPLTGTDDEWILRYTSHIKDLQRMRGDKS